MIVFPNAKINLGLRIVSRRNDGYHNLETIFFPIPVNDILEIIEYHEPMRSAHIPFSTSGLKIEGKISNNLCMKAYKLLKKDFPSLPHVRMHLHKTIPSGAGLGGGSADAAFALRLLNDKFSLGLRFEQLIDYSIQLGSDCPFFLLNKPCFATGRGEILEPVETELSSYKFLIVYPGIHINTGRAFLEIESVKPKRSVKEIIADPIETWKKELGNDFEGPAFKQYPVIGKIKEQLYAEGALYASMTGSGSTVYGIFSKDKELKFSFPAGYFIKEIVF
jgi:4-diphosphocytidyl-2-C-methyl-D-erythritol kinase